MPARSRAPKQEEAVKETTVVICGEEKEWLERFARCLREKAQPRLNVQLFADADELRRYLAEHRAELAVGRSHGTSRRSWERSGRRPKKTARCGRTSLRSIRPCGAPGQRLPPCSLA